MKISLPNDLLVEIDKNNFTASVIGCGENIESIIIPRSFIHESEEYIITKINQGSFISESLIKKIEFPEDSELITIENGAILGSSLNTLNIPKSVKIIEDGWCKLAQNLNKLSISPENGNFTYLDDDKKIIVGKSDPNNINYDEIIFANRDVKEIDVPSEIKAIRSYAFSSCKKIGTITFSENSQLEIIGNGAFCNSSLASIYIPSSVREIGHFCFIFCFSLNKVLFSKDSQLCSIGQNAFEQSMLRNIKLPKKLQKIDKKMFYFCKNLQTIYFPKSLKSSLHTISQSAFENSSLLSISIPSYVDKIEQRAFCNCYNLEIVEFSNDSKLESIEESVFQGSSIKTITIPSNVKQIEKYSFFNCQNLVKICFNEDSQLNSIHQNAFFNSSLENFSIPSNLTDLKEGWCNGLSFLNKISISSKNERYSYLDEKMIISKINSEDEEYKVIDFVRRDAEQVLIPSFIEKIGAYSMNLCDQLITVKFSDESKLKSIEKFAFANSSITNILIPSSVEIIDESSFDSCYNLLQIEFAENSELKTIKKNAFKKTPLKKINIPNKVESLQIGWCNSMKFLTQISIDETNKNFTFLDDDKKIIIGKSNIKNDSFDSLIIACRDTEKVVIPNCIEKICSYAFSNCYKLETVDFECNSNLREIEKGAFNNSAIEEIFIPASVESIGKKAFANCDNLRFVEFEENSQVQVFGDFCFSNSFIKSIKIPKSVKSIGSSAFFDCNNLKKIEFEENSVLNSIGKLAFFETSIQNITIPKNVVKMEEKVFQSCFNLKSIELLADELEVDFSFIYECSNILLISIPNANKISVLNIYSHYLCSVEDLTLFTCNDALLFV